MSDPGSLPARVFDSPADDPGQFRAVSRLAIAGALLSAGAPAAMLTPALEIVPIVAGAVNLLALGRIARRRPALAGRRAALAGLLVSVAFAAAAPVDGIVYRRLLRREARQFVAIWFDAIQRDGLQEAHQLMIDPRQRLPAAQPLSDAYRRRADWGKEVDRLAHHPVIRTLRSLGSKATVRFYDTGEEWQSPDGDAVRLIYAVSYDDPREGRRTVFVAVVLERIATDGRRAGWRLLDVDDGASPAS